MTKAELKREARRRAEQAHRSADAAKCVAPKPHQMQATHKNNQNNRQNLIETMLSLL